MSFFVVRWSLQTATHASTKAHSVRVWRGLGEGGITVLLVVDKVSVMMLWLFWVEAQCFWKDQCIVIILF